MSNNGRKTFVFLLCVLMVIGGLDLGTLAGAVAGPGTSIAGRMASSRGVKSYNTTTFLDWRAGSANNITVYNQTDGELQIMGYQYFSSTIPVGIAIRGMAADSKGNLYIAESGGNGGRIIKVDPLTFAIIDLGRPVPSDDGQNKLTVDKNDTVWGGGRSYDNNAGQASPARSGIIWRLDTKTMRFDVADKAELGVSQARCTASDKNGTIWSGTLAWTGTPGTVVARTDPTTGVVTRINNGQPLIAGNPSYGIARITAANNGMIYAGTGNGPTGLHLIKIDPTTNAFSILNGGNPLLNGEGTGGMTTAKNGTIYIGTSGPTGVIFKLDPTTDTWTNMGKPPIAGSNSIGDMAAAPDGSVYATVGTNLGGMEPHLLKIDVGTGAMIDMGIPIPGASGAGFIAVGGDGTVWGSGSNNQIFRMSQVYEKFPVARLDRTSVGRMFSDNFELGAINWETGSSPGGTNFKRVVDASRPAGDQYVYEQQDMTSAAAYSRAGAWGPANTDSLSFITDPGAVMEVKIKFVGTPGGGGGGPWDIRLFMSGTSYANNYGLFFDIGTSQIRLYRDWAQIGNTYSNLALNKGYWYDVKWKVYHTAVAPGGAFTVWINGTKIFNEVPLPAPHHGSGAVMLGTRALDASFDAVRLYKDTNITVTGLQAGQKVGLYYSNGTLIKSVTAAGAAITLGVDNVSFPLSGYFTVTATDGTTLVLTTSVLKDIYGGDSYNFVTPATAGSVWRYLPMGTFLSKPFDATINATWLNIGWNGKKPDQTNISLRTRTAPTMAGLAQATWSARTSISGTAITSGPNEWMQFEAMLNSTDITKSPELDDVSISYKAFPAFTLNIAQGPPLVYPNDIVEYNITYDQTGIDLAKDVWITDTLPSELTFVNSSADAARTGSVWHFTNVQPKTHNLLVIRARVSKDAKDGTAIKNNASIKFTDTLDAVIGNFPSEFITTVVQRPGFQVGLKAPTTAVPGDLINYTVNYTQTGSGLAKFIWLNLTFDKNVTIKGSSADIWRTGLSWHIPGTTPVATINITAKVNASAGDGSTLKASAVLNHTYPNGYMPAGVTAGPVTTTITRPVMTFVKTVDVTTALPGDIITYKLYYNNTGTAAGKFVITDALDQDLEFLISTSDANRTGSTWTFASVPAGSHNVLNIKARIKNDSAENITIKNKALGNLTSASGVVMGLLSTNEVSLKVGFLPLPKITVAVVVDRSKVEWNDTVNFTIYYNNTGDDAATSVTIKEPLPTGLTYQSNDAETNRIGSTWEFTTVPTGSHSFKVKAKVNAGVANNTILTNTVSLNYTGPRGKDMAGSKASASITVYVPGKLPGGDKTRPSITDRSPVPDDNSVASDARIEITFSKAMNQTATQSAFSITPSVSGKFSWNGNKLIFTPDKPLAKGQKYVIKVDPTAKDTSGNLINPISSWSFTVKGKSGGGTAVSNLLCLGGIIAAIVVALAAVGYWLTNRKKPKPGPERSSTRRPITREDEEAMDQPTTIAPREPVRPRPRAVPVVPVTTKEEVAPPEETIEEPELAQTKEIQLPQEEQPEPGPPIEEPPVPPEEKVPEEPPLPEEKASEPVKEEAPPAPEEMPLEPATEPKAEPGPPTPEPEVKKKTTDLDDILKRLKE